MDEQLVAVIARINLHPHENEATRKEWERLVDGVRNNQPDAYLEWTSVRPVKAKKIYRDAFGFFGDDIRRLGYGAIGLGPVNKSALNRFSVKLGQALYYKHCNEVLNGRVITKMFGPKALKPGSDAEKTVVTLAPALAEVLRGNRSLADRFTYRFNVSEDCGAFHAVVRFNNQLFFYIACLRKAIADELPPDFIAGGIGDGVDVLTTLLS